MDHTGSSALNMILALAAVAAITALAALGRVSSMEVSGNRLFRIVLRFTTKR